MSNTTSAQVSTEAVEGVTLSNHTVGLITGIITFIIVSSCFSAAACLSMWKYQKQQRIKQQTIMRQMKLKEANRTTVLQHRNNCDGVIITLSVQHCSSDNLEDYSANDNQAYLDVPEEEKHQIAVRHYLRNGFHLRYDDEETKTSPGKSKLPLCKVHSSPPINVVRKEPTSSNSEQETQGNTTPEASRCGNELLVPDLSPIVRASSLKVYRHRASRQEEAESVLQVLQ